MVVDHGVGRQHFRDLPPPQHPRFDVSVIRLAKPVDGLRDGVQRVEQHEAVIPRAQPRALAPDTQDASALPDEAVADLEPDVVNGPVGGDLERERGSVGEADVPQFVGC